MTVEQEKVVDFVGEDNSTGTIRLSISDHLDWADPKNEHLFTLQEKLNAYLAFIESEELYEKFPRARGRKVEIVVYGKYPLSLEAQRFYSLARTRIREAGFELEFVLLAEDEAQART